MKCVYSTLRPPIDHKSDYIDWITECNQLLTISSRGLAAFTSSFPLKQTQPPSSISHHLYVVDLNTPYQPYLVTESELELNIIEWDPSGTKLLVCDIKGCVTIFTSKDYLISEWRLGFRHVFAAEQFIASTWYHPGIVCSINVVSQNLKNSSNHLEYTDKIQQNNLGASLRLFGGKSAEGCLLISKTGLVCCLTLMADGSVEIVSDSLTPLRARIEAADIGHNHRGSFIVATSAGTINSTISFYEIQLVTKSIVLDEVDAISNNQEGRRVSIRCKQYNSFHLNIMSQMLNEKDQSSTTTFERVNHIKFVTKDSCNDVLVEVSGQNLSLIELWELEPKRRPPVHSAILSMKSEKNGPKSETIAPTTTTNNTAVGNNMDVDSNAGGDTMKQEQTTNSTDTGTISNNNSHMTKEWTFKGNYITDKELISIQVPKFKLFGSNRQLNLILLAYKNSTVCCMRKEDLQPIDGIFDLSNYSLREKSQQQQFKRPCFDGINGISRTATAPLYTNNNSDNNAALNSNRKNVFAKPAGLKAKQKDHRSIYITNMRFSANQTLFIAIDSISQLHVVRLPTLIACQDSKDEETYLQYILEYCLVTGNDWWDVLVCVKPDSIENICDKFYDAYERQPKHIQRKYFNRQLMIRASLYRCLNNASSLCKSSDCHTMIMLNSIATTLKSTLRSMNQDNPADSLAMFLKTQATQTNYLNCNNVIEEIHEKEFYVEPNLIQCLQPLSQWVTDLAIFLIASLPQRARFGSLLPGAGLHQNKEALETLRELLVIIKIWSTQTDTCKPIVHRQNDQIDVLGTLFRLISTCYMTLITSQSNQPNDALINESAQFANNIAVPQFVFLLKPIGVARPLFHRDSDCNADNSNQPVKNEEGPLSFEYSEQPTMPELVLLDSVEGSINMTGNRQVDVVRNISLGAHPKANIRHCTRCESVSLINPTTSGTTIVPLRSWDQRWITSCVCGGSWAQADRLRK